MPCLHSIASKVSALKTKGWGLTQRLESPGDLVTHMVGVCFLPVGNSAGLSDTTRICGLSMWSFQVGSLNFLTAWQHLEKNQEEVASPFVTYYQRSNRITSVIISPLKFKEKEHWFLLLMRENLGQSHPVRRAYGMDGDAADILWHMVCLRWQMDETAIKASLQWHAQPIPLMFNIFFFMFNFFKVALSIIK